MVPFEDDLPVMTPGGLPQSASAPEMDALLAVGGAGSPPTNPPATISEQGVATLPQDTIGDIPPPPIPPPPQSIGSSSNTPPATRSSSVAYRAPVARPARAPRFGPGVPVTGGAPGIDGEEALGVEPDDVGEILRRLASMQR